MKSVITKIVGFVIVLLCATSLSAQFVLISDPILRTALNTDYRSYMSLDSLSLDTVAAASKTGTLQLQYYGFTNVSELKYFKNINFYQTVNNNIVNIPDFTGFTSLSSIDLRGNPWINFSELDPIKNQLTMILFRQIANGPTVKDFSFLTSSFPNLKSIQLSNYNAEVLPDFSLFSGLTMLKVNNNHLTFEDLLPLTTLPSYASILTAMPQNNFTNDTNIVAFLGTGFTLSTPIDTALTGITYDFYKDSVLIQSSSANTYTKSSVALSDSGTYFISIKSAHPFFAGSSLRTGNYKVTTSTCPVLSDIEIEVSDACDLIPVQVLKINNQSNYPFSAIKFKNKIRGDQYSFSMLTPQSIPAGIYDLHISDINGCGYDFNNYKTVHVADKCSDVFSPNGDGVSDIFFIEGTGTVSIRNKQGVLVRECSLPCYWDGNDQNGSPVAIGIYSLSFSTNELRRVTVLR